MKINKQRVFREIKEWAEAIIIALILTLVIRAFVIQAFKIPSGSMIPTLQIGDKLFVNKFIYKFKDPERWDVMVFKYPEDPSKDFIKRVIATEGESLEIRNGDIYINNERVNLPAEIVDNYYYNDGPFGSEGEAITIPENSYYVLGDNSVSSRDSRYWGFVSDKNVVGKAVFRWWPIQRMGTIDRIFEENIEANSESR